MRKIIGLITALLLVFMLAGCVFLSADGDGDLALEARLDALKEQVLTASDSIDGATVPGSIEPVATPEDTPNPTPELPIEPPPKYLEIKHAPYILSPRSLEYFEEDFDLLSEFYSDYIISVVNYAPNMPFSSIAEIVQRDNENKAKQLFQHDNVLEWFVGKQFL